MSIQKVNLLEESASMQDFWKLHSLGKLNNHEVQLIKLQGEFDWHSHDHEDKLFMVIEGVLEIHFRDRTVELQKNEFLIVPKGVENKPVAKDQATLMIFEPQR